MEHCAGTAPAIGLNAGAGERGPDVLLAVVEVLDRDPPELALEDFGATLRLGADRQDAALDADATPAAAAHRTNDDRAATVDVAVEQRVQRHDRVVVLGRGVDEVDDEARFLAWMAARDAPDALLVDALRSGWREMDADGGARRVPALGEQLRIDQDVNVTALVACEDRRELALGRLAGDGLRLQSLVAEGFREVVCVADSGGVDDAGNAVEARPVEARDGDVERRLVEQFGEHLLVELGVHLTAAQRHLGDRADARAGRDAHAAKRRDHAAARRLREIETGGLGREEVGYVARDEGAGRRHADEYRARPVADRRGSLLAERGVRLVADDDRVGVRNVAGVANEPLVGLDGDRAVRAVLAQQERARDALLVAPVA